MITSAYARTMAAYNAAMNTDLYAAASRLSDAARRLDRGAFWGSIHGTLNHLLWGDRMWMARFAGWTKPALPLAESGTLFTHFDDMAAARAEDDARISEWAEALTDDWLVQDQAWFSASTGRNASTPRALLVVHMFNHQAHHRGQIHAMLTAAGQQTGATDMPAVLSRIVA